MNRSLSATKTGHPEQRWPRTIQNRIIGDIRLAAKAMAEQVGHFYEEGATVSAEAGLELTGEGIKAVAIEIVVVANVKGRSWIGGVAKEKLPAYVRRQHIVINASAGENEPRELITGTKRKDNL